jgi:hypothetical protein
VASDSPLVSIGKGGGIDPQGAGRIIPDPVERVRENIQRISEARMKNEASAKQLEEMLVSMHQSMVLIFTEDKRHRVDRVRLTAGRDELRNRNLELKKLRMAREAEVSQKRASLKEFKKNAFESVAAEIERLEKRSKDLKGDVEALQETMRVHCRDRQKVFQELSFAANELQDMLTEAILWRIQGKDGDPVLEGGRTGIAGVIAEFLGRLLVLESEEAQVTGVLKERSNKAKKS